MDHAFCFADVPETLTVSNPSTMNTESKQQKNANHQKKTAKFDKTAS
jgi:hypothetical protein